MGPCAQVLQFSSGPGSNLKMGNGEGDAEGHTESGENWGLSTPLLLFGQAAQRGQWVVLRQVTWVTHDPLSLQQTINNDSLGRRNHDRNYGCSREMQRQQ